jgi:hypothetical protein
LHGKQEYALGYLALEPVLLVALSSGTPPRLKPTGPNSYLSE